MSKQYTTEELEKLLHENPDELDRIRKELQDETSPMSKTFIENYKKYIEENKSSSGTTQKSAYELAKEKLPSFNIKEDINKYLGKEENNTTSSGTTSTNNGNVGFSESTVDKIQNFYKSFGFIVSFIFISILISAVFGEKFLNKFLLLVLASQLLINSDKAIAIIGKFKTVTPKKEETTTDSKSDVYFGNVENGKLPTDKYV